MSDANTPETCPQCGSTELIPIRYGYPLIETFEQEERGELMIGGCMVSDDSPTLHCRACGENSGRYGFSRESGPSRPDAG